jgi:hypothetical protein
VFSIRCAGCDQALQSLASQSTDVQIRVSSLETRPAPPALQCVPISDEHLEADVRTLQADVTMLKSNIKARGVVFAEPSAPERTASVSPAPTPTPTPTPSMAEAKGILDEWQSDLKEQRIATSSTLTEKEKPSSLRDPQPVPRASADVQQLVTAAVAEAMARQTAMHTQHLQSQVDQLSRALYSLSAFAAPTSAGKLSRSFKLAACMRACVHACVHACVRACVHACMRARACVCVCVCVCYVCVMCVVCV